MRTAQEFPCHCKPCDGKATPLGDATAFQGVGRGNQDIRVWMQRFHCDKQHTYMVEVFEEDA